MTRIVQGQIVEVLIGERPLLATLGEKQASPDGAYLVSTPVPRVSVTLDGFAGDRHAGPTRRADGRTPFYPRGTLIRNSRQVSLVAVEELAALAAALGVPQIAPAWLGANLAVSGIPHLSRLPPGSRLFFPHEATLVIAAENMPCVYPGKALQARFPLVPELVAQFPRYARGLRGLVAWVERPGAIETGDAVRVAMTAALPDAAGR
jgi:hypothetical protein